MSGISGAEEPATGEISSFDPGCAASSVEGMGSTASVVLSGSEVGGGESVHEAKQVTAAAAVRSRAINLNPFMGIYLLFVC